MRMADTSAGLDILNDYFKVVTPEKLLLDYLYMGRLQLKSKGDTIVAIGNLKKSIELDTNHGRGWGLNKEIAELLYARKDYCGAVQSYTLYLDSLPKNDQYYVSDTYKKGLAQFYCKDDTLRYQKAEAIFKQVAELVPKIGPRLDLGW